MSVAAPSVEVDLSNLGIAPSHPVAAFPPVGNTTIVGRSCVLFAVSLYNAASATAAVALLYDNGGYEGAPVLMFTLAAASSLYQNLSDNGLRFDNGLYLALSGTTIDASFWLLYDANGVE